MATTGETANQIARWAKKIAAASLQRVILIALVE
jgi:hypothetical protein